jgi:preprotein translocase subunit YajC
MGPFIPIILIIAVFYFIIIRPQQRQAKQRQDLLGALKVNDRVQTVGGLLATVVDVREHKVRLKIDETSNVKAWFTRSAIHRIVEDDAKLDEK